MDTLQVSSFNMVITSSLFYSRCAQKERCKAIEIVKETYHDIDYKAIESSTTTCAEGMLVKLACKLRNEEKTRDEVLDVIEKEKMHIAFIGKTSYEYIACLTGMICSGNVVVPFDPNISVEEAQKIIAKEKAKEKEKIATL